MKKLRLAAVLFAVSSFLASGNTFADDQSQQMSKAPERLDITFDYQRGGIASSIRDLGGRRGRQAGSHDFHDALYRNAWVFRAAGCRADLGGAFQSCPNDIRSG